MSTSIKLVSTDPQLAQALRETGLPCVTIPSEALSGLAQAGAPQPAVLVVDLRDQPQLPQALPLLKRQHPTTGILLVASQFDPALMLEAMRAGVNEFVTHPVAVPELQLAIKRLLGNLAPSVRGDVFAFVGAKGGVGTTTTAVNVATSLALTRESCLLIDLHAACGDAAVFVGAEPRFSVVDALDNVQRLDPAFFNGLVVRGKSGLDLLGASGRPVTGSLDPARLRTLLDFASQTRRFTVLDVPRSDTVALDSLEIATKIVLVVNQELATVRSAARMANSLQQRYGSDRVNVVITRYDDGAEIGKDDLERVVGRQVGYVFPNNYPVTISSLNKGRPLVLDNHTKLASAFTNFARSLAGMPAPRQEEKSGLMALLGGRKR